MKNASTPSPALSGARLLKCVAALLLLVAAGHLLCLFQLETVFRFYGIEPFMQRLARYGAALPYLTTVGVAAGLAGCALYALSGAGVIRRLPLLQTGLYAIAAAFLLRSVVGVARMIVEGAFPAAEWTAALAAGAIGTLVLAGGVRTRKNHKQ